ncbi:hypothetical protein SH2C18_13790 [Clostridium sediminicola]|uniref:hypothetical protein n=1 Tax=Clostridium sediminicola TaxID=3114879 RepID=UPI0031F1FBAB
MKNFNDYKEVGVNENSKGNENKMNHKKHGVLMMLCCLLPILLIMGLPLFGFKGVSFSYLIFLLCPLMHVGMMLFMFKSKER